MESAEPAASGESRLGLEPAEVVDDIINAVHHYCAAGFDSLDEKIVSGIPDLSADQTRSILQGTAQLYEMQKVQISTQMEKFERYALEVCLHVPAGLIVEEASSPDEDANCSESAEEQLDTELDQLRREIAATNASTRRLKQEIVTMDKELAGCGNLGPLRSVVEGAGDDKENLAEDAAAIADAALRLQPLLARAEQLRRGSAGSAPAAACAGDSRDASAEAEKEIAQRKSKVGVPMEGLALRMDE